MLPTLFAQSIGEYGGLGSLASGIQQATYSLSAWFGGITPTTWVIVAGVVIAFAIFSRR